MIETSRRGFITGLVSLVAAPAIVRVASIMPVKAEPKLTIEQLLKLRIADAERVIQENFTAILYGDAKIGRIKFNGLELTYDKFCPKDQVYLFSERAIGWEQIP
jgi:hypothetical protein